MALTQIKVGREFTFKVSNGLVKIVEGNFSGCGVYFEVTDQTSPEPLRLELDGNGCKIFFKSGAQAKPVKMIIWENSNIEAFENPINLREELLLSHQALKIPFASTSNALTFDQSHYTRGLGQIEVARKLELAKTVKLTNSYDLFSGMGFGAIIAASVALGFDLPTLKEWWVKELRKAVKLEMIEAFSSQRRTKSIEKALKKFFSDSAGRAYLMCDIPKRLVFYLKDIEKKITIIDNKDALSMPVWEALALVALNPIDFKTRPKIGKGKDRVKMLTVYGDFEKSPNRLLRMGNNHLKITSIKCPARSYRHKNRKMNLENLAMISTELNYDDFINDGLGVTEFTCSQIDHIKKYDTSKKGLEAAINSSIGVV